MSTNHAKAARLQKTFPPRNRASSLEALESRIAPAAVTGIVPDKGYLSVSFYDALGDLVKVSLTNQAGGPAPKGYSFEITLDGGASNYQDIQEIDVAGPTNGPTEGPNATYLHVSVIPQQIGKLSSPGFTQIGLITDHEYDPVNPATPPDNEDNGPTPTALAGITVTGAVINDLEWSGNELGSISENLSGVNFRYDYAIGTIAPGTVSFGTINAPNTDIGDLDLIGQKDLSNPITGTINAHSLYLLHAPYSDLLGNVNVSSPTTFAKDSIATTVEVNNIVGQLNLQTVNSITANNISGGITVVGTISTPPALVKTTSPSGAIEEVTDTATLNLYAHGCITGNISAVAPSGFNGPDPTLTLNLTEGGGFAGSITAGVVQGIGKNGLLTFGNGNFTGSITTTSGDISPIAITTPGALFSGTLDSADQVGSITAGGISGAVVTGTEIGTITANGANSGILSNTFTAEATEGGTGNGSIAALTAIGSISGNDVIASGAIGNITSTAGSIGGSVPITHFQYYQLDEPSELVDLTGPAANTIQAGSINNINALHDIGGNQIETTGAIGNVTATAGRIAFNEITSFTGSIGNITAHSSAATFIFDTGGNIVIGTTGNSGDSESAEFSGSAIEGNTIDALNGSIGNITATAGAFGGYANSTTVYADAVLHSNFAANTIGTVTASAASTTTGDAADAIAYSSFVSGVNAFEEGASIGNVLAQASGGNAIQGTTFHAASGNIGNVTGYSVSGEGIAYTQIDADEGNVGNVSGAVAGYGHKAGLDTVSISAGSGGGAYNDFGIGNISGASLDGNGIVNVNAVSGTGGIGDIYGSNNGNINVGIGSGILTSTFFTTGGIGDVSGFSNTSTGIDTSNFSAGSDGISSVTAAGNVTANGGADGITTSTFVTTGSIGDITVGTETPGFGGAGAGKAAIFNSTFTAGGNIGDITAHTSGLAAVTVTPMTTTPVEDGNDAIDQSTFTAGAYLTFAKDISASSDGAIGTIVAITDHGNQASMTDDGIAYSFFSAATGGIGVDGGVNATATSLGEDGIHHSTFVTTGSIGNITVDDLSFLTEKLVKNEIVEGGGAAGAGDVAILGSTFMAAFNIGSIDAHTSGLAKCENSGSGYDAINSSYFTAGGYFNEAGGISVPSFGQIANGSNGGIGTLTAITDHGTAGSTTDDAISNSQFKAGTGGISAATGINADSTDTGEYGIMCSQFVTTGSIGKINVGENSGVGNVGILNSTFTAAGSIGNINAYTSGEAGLSHSGCGTGYDAIEGSTFTAGAYVAIPVDGSTAAPMSGQIASGSTGGIGAIYAFSNHGDPNSTFDEGINNSNFYAGTGGIASGDDQYIYASSTSTGDDGIKNSNFFTTGSIGGIYVNASGPNTGLIRNDDGGSNAGAGSEGIYGSTFVAAGSIGNVYAETSGLGAEPTSDGFTGIDDSHFTAGASTSTSNGVVTVIGASVSGTGSIGSLTGQSDSGSGYGIANSTFLAGSTSVTADGIASISGYGSSGGIYKVLAQTYGSIGGINGSTITSSGFNAEGNIGDGVFTDTAINAGYIQNSVFVAGVYLSSFEQGTPGNGAGTNLSSTESGSANAELIGFYANGQNSASDGAGLIGAVEASGNISSSTFLAGVTNLGADNVLNTPALPSTNPDADSFTPGSGIGPINAPGGIGSTFVAGGSIGATTVEGGGSFTGNTYIAGDSTEGATGIGSITVVLDLGYGAGPQAIANSSLYSVTNIGALSGTVDGSRVHITGYVAGISNLFVEAIGTVGNITGENDATGSNGLKTSGIYNLQLDATGVGNVLGEVVDSGSTAAADNSTIIGFGIRNSTLLVGTGGVGSVSGNTSSTTIGSYAMDDATVVTSGSISSTGAVTGVGIEATGEVLGSLFEAGAGPLVYDTTVTTGGKIGTITINSVAGTTDGALASTSIVASVGTSDDTFGNIDDTIAHGGAIGVISIATAEVYDSTEPGYESFGIEAATIASITVGGVTKTIPGVLNGNTLVTTGPLT